MRIYTSYFAIANKLPKDLVQISISLFPPKNFAGKEYKKIAPTKKYYSIGKDLVIRKDTAKSTKGMSCQNLMK